MNTGASSRDIRAEYTFSIMYEALDQTKMEFGDYEVQVIGYSLPNYRKLQQVEEGRNINVAMALTTQEWERRTIPIRIPLRRGILNYRLLLIHKDNLTKFSNIASVEELKKLRVGLRRNWATNEVMAAQDYNIVNAFSYDAIFNMLQLKRYDYVPRGIHEIYDEVLLRQHELPDITVAPNIAIYIPAPFYMFVSKKTPHLAERLETGLRKLVDNGFIEQQLHQYYGQHIKKANLKNRRIINVGNPLLPPETPLEDKSLWTDWQQVN
ncbi:substrate-binding periplasmic protein [Saccharobesus litoralis]|uniref:substrate-binding periplasmic protein n=1 Tax=Saccharobesus litoralis TaxID=2172099 RepID=UPI00131F3A15|nr:transporter substrate-binding domain-containing protein [Saccharobesus litoralis]